MDLKLLAINLIGEILAEKCIVKNDIMLRPVIFKDMVLNEKSIESFFSISKRGDNDISNKVREYCILNIINNVFGEDYYYIPNWNLIRTNLLNSLSMKFGNEKLICRHMAGRKYNYDFDINGYHFEFKFNTKSIEKIPQFVSLMNPSKYTNGEFESFYYDNFLIKLSNKYNLNIPQKEDYLKIVGSPTALKEIQLEYYKGCKQSSKYNGNSYNIELYKDFNKNDNEAREKFISNTELDINFINNYMLKTQIDKYYLLYKDGSFTIVKQDIDDFLIIKQTKNRFSYDCLTKNGNTLKFLLRWKNGNGIAYPAFQVSYIGKT